MIRTLLAGGAVLAVLALFPVPAQADPGVQLNANDMALLNGVRQAFNNGADTFYVRTLTPGTSTVYYKEGYYRAPMAVTGVVLHTGFRCGSGEPPV